MTLLEIENLHTRFRTSRGTVQAVNGVNLAIDEQEIVGLVGESGSGKSVLADSIMGLVDEPGEVHDGDITFRGESLLSKTETEMQSIRGDRISIIFQDPMNSLNPTLTIGEQIAETIRLHQDLDESVSFPAEITRKILGASKNSEAWRRAIEMIESVEIPVPSSRALQFPHQFSGGMRQRAMIAMALSCKPDLLIADEPTTALDVTIQAQILDELRDLKDEFETSILLITHDLGIISEMCDRVNVMYAGEIIERGPADVLFDDPQHPYTQRLLKSVPQPHDPRDELSPIPGNVLDLIDIPYECHFAPRCPEATSECFMTKPEMRRVGEANHEAACLYRGQGTSDERVSNDEVSN
jgi:oligopeptide/dipeptide ABC transporter ATP-binding protein